MISKSTINDILNDPFRYDNRIKWTLQGFGMLRCYLDDQRISRLHVWSRDHRATRVSQSYSDVHTHPWDFESEIYYGNMVNIRYTWDAHKYGTIRRQLMLPGEDAKMLSMTEYGELFERQWDFLSPGDRYTQKFDEIHRSLPFTGCVTVIERDRAERPDEAYTFFLGEWVTAKPREATRHEIATIIGAVADISE